MYVLSAAESRALDARSIELGTPGVELMENAGQAVVACLERRFAEDVGNGVLVLCGKGNNGGDGFVVARQLVSQGIAVHCLLVARLSTLTGDAAAHAQRLREAGCGIREEPAPAGVEAAFAELAGAYRVLVDALLGTGLSRPPEGAVKTAIDCANAARAGQPGIRVLAVDLPSGLDADSGHAAGAVLPAERTVTFGTLKRAHALPVSRGCVGAVDLAEIGLHPGALAEQQGNLRLVERAEVAAAMPRRRVEAHKGDSGHLLVVAGASGTGGAAVLCGRSALRAGVGLLTIASADEVRQQVATSLPEAMTAVYTDWSGEEMALQARARAAVVVGPGLGQGPSARAAVATLLSETGVPVVVDADALNLVAPIRAPLRPEGAGLVLTPHPGEMGRLCGISNAEVQRDRVAIARDLASRSGAVVVLKGSGTVVALPGGEAWLNPTGGPILGAGGSGDVLAGVVGALLAQGLPPGLAARVAVWWHGAAGDRLAQHLGDSGVLASEIADELPATRQSLVGDFASTPLERFVR